MPSEGFAGHGSGASPDRGTAADPGDGGAADPECGGAGGAGWAAVVGAGVWSDGRRTGARRSLTSTASWPQGLDDALGTSSSRLYVRPAEARRLYAMISEAFGQLADDPEIAGRRDPD